jgi:antitoxin (DNA-binding transcriptional repressor) of toxin-antitoxin stability system
MATIRVSEAEAIRDIAGLLARVRLGAEVVIENDDRAVAVVRPAVPAVGPGRLLSEMIAAAEARGSTAVIDEDFASDVAAAVAAHREPF